jgi:hypothetical protein
MTIYNHPGYQAVIQSDTGGLYVQWFRRRDEKITTWYGPPQEVYDLAAQPTPPTGLTWFEPTPWADQPSDPRLG